MDGSLTTTAPRVHAGAGRRHQAARVERSAGAQARLEARVAGVLWLMVIVTGAFAFFAQSTMRVEGDAAATAGRIVESEPLFRLALAANLAAGVCYLGVTVLLYGLLKPVGRSVSRLAAAFGAAGVIAGAATAPAQLAPLALLGDGAYLAAFTAGQRQALALTFLGLAGQGSSIGMMFFGFQCVLLGLLVARSTFLPRMLGVLLGVGGASYVISAFASVLSPAFGARLAPWILPAALVGEGSLCLWLMVKGVDVGRWHERAPRQ